jgi:hypothetical protein
VLYPEKAAQRQPSTGQSAGLKDDGTGRQVAPPVDRGALRDALLLGVLVLAVYLLTATSDLRNNGDTLLRWQTTQAIVDHGRLWIAHPVATGTRVAVGLGGHLYVSAYGPGQAIFMIPFYVFGSVCAAVFHLPRELATLYASRMLDLVLGAVLAVLVSMFGLAIGYSRRTSVVLGLLFAFATAAWPDAQGGNEHTQVSLFVLLSVYALWRALQHSPAAPRLLFLAGTASGVSIFTRYDAVIFIPVLAVWLAWVERRRGSAWTGIMRDSLVYAAGVVPWVVLLALWNLLRFGSPFNVALHLQTFGEPPWVALLGLLVSPGKGVIWYIPLLFLLPAAWLRLYRRLPALAVLFVACMAVTLAFYSNVLYWHGDPAWGPRYLYEALPYAIIPLGELLGAPRGHIMQVALVALTVVSICIQMAAVSVTEWRFWYHLEVIQEHTSQKFNWGPTAYTYYWTVDRSPLLWQFRDVSEVVEIDAFGQTQYREVKRPTACTGPTRCLDNPAHFYPMNTLDFWWADIRHPLFGAGVRAALAIALLVVALAAAGELVRSLRQRAGLPP